MKKPFFIVSILLALLFAIATPASTNENVFAQDPNACYDATGRVIPCPPTPGGGGEDHEDDKQPSGGSNNPSPNPTATPLPLANPNEDGSTEKKKDWSHTCKPDPNNVLALANCLLSVGETCQADGGDAVPGSPGSDGSITVTCTHIVIPPTELPLDNPTGSGKTGIKEASCQDNQENPKPEWLLTCVTDFVNACGKAGGISTTNSPAPGTVNISCSVDAFIITDPSSLPLAAPEDNLIGSCNTADGNLRECMDEYQRLCENGLLVIKVDIYNGVYDFYCIPDETVPQLNLPFALPTDDGSTEDTNWTGGCYGDDEDQCVSDLAALCKEEGGDLSVWYDGTGAGVYCENSTPADGAAAPNNPTDLATPAEGDPTEAHSAGCGGSKEFVQNCIGKLAVKCVEAGGKVEDVQVSTDGGSGQVECSKDVYGSIAPEDLNELTAEGAPTQPGNFPPGGWLPWIVGTIVILISLLLPAVQKVREAAARTRAESHAAKIDLINKDDDGTEASDYLLEIDGIKGESKQHIKKATLTVRKAGNDHQE